MEEEQDTSGEILERVEGDTDNILVKDKPKIASPGNDKDNASKEIQIELVNSRPGEDICTSARQNVQTKYLRRIEDENCPAETLLSPQVVSVSDIAQEIGDENTNNIVDEDPNEIDKDEAGQFVRKCSQGFGFFVS